MDIVELIDKLISENEKQLQGAEAVYLKPAEVEIIRKNILESTEWETKTKN